MIHQSVHKRSRVIPRRRVNYRHFTGREWGVAQNYHLALDSGMLGVEGCVDLIAAAFQREE